MIEHLSHVVFVTRLNETGATQDRKDCQVIRKAMHQHSLGPEKSRHEQFDFIPISINNTNKFSGAYAMYPGERENTTETRQEIIHLFLLLLE